MVNKHVIGIGVTLLGAAQLSASYFASGWLSGVLVNLGTATLLFVPLFLVEQRMEQRVDRAQASVAGLERTVEDATTELRETLDSLRTSFAAADRNLQERRSRTISDVEAAPSHVGVRKALAEAVDDRVISAQWGMRVRVVHPDLAVYARLLLNADESIRIWLEQRGGESIGELTWTPDLAANELMMQVAQELRAASLLGANYDPGLMFEQLRHSLSTARAVKQRFAVLEDMSEAQELVPPQWMVYDWGLGAWHDDSIQPYYITIDRIRDQDITRHMLEKSWVHESSFREALTTAQLLLEAGRLSDG